MKPLVIKQESPLTQLWTIAQYCSAAIITAAIILLWVNALMGILLIALAFLLFLLALVVSIISFFGSLRCNTHQKRLLLIWHMVNVLAIFLWIYNPNDKCDAFIMERHYQEYHAQMGDLYRNVYHQLKPGCRIYLEFEKGKISNFNVRTKDGQGKGGWDPSQEKVDSLLTLSGLDKKDLDYIEDALKDMHCISISVTASPEKPYEIGFRRVLLDKYDYQIYPKDLTPEKQDSIGSAPGNILYAPQVVFQYNTGAIGNSNFPDKEKYLLSKKGATPK